MNLDKYHRDQREKAGKSRKGNKKKYTEFWNVGGSMDYMENRRNAFWGLRAAQGGISGVGSIIQGALVIAEAYDRWYVEDEKRKQKYALAEAKLTAQGDILNKRHEYDRANLLEEIWRTSANIIYPALNNRIIYKKYNQERGLKDVYLVQYYPTRELLQYIKDYYREFGYRILVRDFECTGAACVKIHMRYQFIYEINHPNVCITELIRTRALMGIKMVPWVQ